MMSLRKVFVIKIFICVLGFLFGLGIPRYSLIALVACTVLSLQGKFKLPKMWKLAVTLLLTFTLFHEAVSIYFGFRFFSVIFVHPMMFFSAYLLGMSLPYYRPQEGTRPVSTLLIGIAAGMATFAILSSINLRLTSTGDLIRRASSYWDKNTIINAPIFGLYASVGITQIPIMFFKGRGLIKIDLLEWIIISTASLMGFIANFLFQNRSPLIALLLAWSFVLFDLMVHSSWEEGSLQKLIKRLLSISTILTGFFIFFPHFFNLLFLRFKLYGLTSGGRTDAWYNVFTHILYQPFGGRKINLGGPSYAHNLWFDVANDSGLIPALLLVVFFVIHGKYLLRFIRLRPSVLKYQISGIFISLFIGAIMEPFLVGSPLHFAFLCLILGLIVSHSSIEKSDPSKASSPIQIDATSAELLHQGQRTIIHKPPV